MYSENYKILIGKNKKKKKAEIKTWRDIPFSWIKITNIVEITILAKAIYGFIEILIKLPMVFFRELEQKNLQFVYKHKD